MFMKIEKLINPTKLPRRKKQKIANTQYTV